MATQRQAIAYGPNGPIYADPAFGTAGGASPADLATGGSPGAIMPAAQSMPDAMNTPWQTQSPLGGPLPGATPSGADPVNPMNTGAGTVNNALGLQGNAYAPAMANPDLLSGAYNMVNGVNPNSGISKLNSNYGQNANYLYLITQGNNVLGGTPDDYFNWFNNYMQQGSTQGGHYVTTGQVLNALFDPNSPISQNIYAKDQNGNAATPDVIVNRFIGTMQTAMKNSAPPLVINALSSMYEQAGAEWQTLTMQGKYSGTFSDYLTQKGLDPASLGM